MYKKYRTIVLVGFPVVLFLMVYLFFGFDGLYGQDSYEYLRYSKSLHLFFRIDRNPDTFFWPLYYPLLGALISFIISNTALSLQLISVMSVGISAVYLNKILELIYSRKNYSILYVTLFFFMSPMVFKTGVLVMSDMLATCFVIGTGYYSIKYIKDQKLVSIYLATIFGVSAVMTRYASVVIIFPFGIYILYYLFKRRNHIVHLFTILILILILLFPHIYFKNHNFSEFLNHKWLQEWSFLNFFKRSFTTVDGYAVYSLPNILYAFSNVFHPKYLILGLLFLIGFFKKKTFFKLQNIFIFSVLLYALFLAGIPFQNSRFLMLSFPFILVILFPVFDIFINKIHSRKKVLIILSIVLLQMVIGIEGLKSVLERNYFERKIVTLIKNYQNNTLYSFDLDIALKGRGLKFDYQNLWVEEYVYFREDALLLFHPTKFQKQWKDKNPIKNWDNLQQKYNLELLEKLPEGWELYKIKRK